MSSPSPEPQPQATVTVTATPEAQPSIGGMPVISILTVGVALLAAGAAIFSAWLQRRTGKDTVKVATEAAEASKASSAASGRSAKAAEDSVALNERTSLGVATRAEADALAKRYQEAAAQLGHANAAVRLAGVYAMSRLADDWPEQRQTCINVLCAYLRMPYELVGSPADLAETQVRRAITEVFIDHWTHREDDPSEWLDNKFDLRQADLHDFKISGLTFTDRVELSQARFYGRCGIEHVEFTQGASLKGALVYGNLAVRGAEITNMNGMFILPGAFLFVRINPDRVATDLRETFIEGGVSIRLPNYGDGKASVHLEGVRLADTGSLHLGMQDRHVAGHGNPHRESQWAKIHTKGWQSEGGRVTISKCLLDSARMEWDFDSLPSELVEERLPTVRRIIVADRHPDQPGATSQPG